MQKINAQKITTKIKIDFQEIEIIKNIKFTKLFIEIKKKLSQKDFEMHSKVINISKNTILYKINQHVEFPLNLKLNEKDNVYFSKYLCFSVLGIRDEKTTIMGRLNYNVAQLVNDHNGAIIRHVTKRITNNARSSSQELWFPCSLKNQC